MSKRQSRGKHSRDVVPTRRKRFLAALTLALISVVSVSLLAQVNSRKKGRKASGDVSLTSFTPTDPSKEYVYAGGRLVATEEGTAAVPAAPTGLIATAGNAQVSLSWTASADATSYNIKRSTTSGGPYTTIATGLTAASYPDSGLTNGITYYYVVSAVNAAGEGPNSTQVSATPAAGSPPLPPASLTATAGNAQVSLSWTASADATSYNVKRSTASGGPYATIATGLMATAYPDNGLINGIAYYYVVSAVNPAGESPNSTQASATPTAPDNAGFAGQTVSSAMAAGGGQSVTVAMSNTGSATWTQGGYVLRSQNPAGNTTWGLSEVALPVASVPPGTSVNFTFTITAPLAAANYHFQWQMFKVSVGYFGDLSPDTVITVSTDPPPPAPTLLGATPSGSSVTLIWQNNIQANYIQVERKLGLSGAYSVIATVFTPSATSYVDQSLAPGTYTYRLRCFVGNGTASPYSNELSATIGGSNPPNAPTNLSASLGSGLSVNLSWTDNSGDETGFKIDRKTGAGAYALLATVGSNIVNYTDTTVSYSTNYTYRVKAINGVLESGYSNESQISTGPPQPPNAPSDLTANVVSSTRVDLAWLDNSSNEDGFKVERKTGAGAFSVIATLGVNATSYSDMTASPSTQYTYQVRSFSNAGGDSAPSNPVTVSTPAAPQPPAAPGNLVATATSSSQINLTWNDNSTNEDGFKIERKQGAGGSYAQIGTAPANAGSSSDTGLSASTPYYYRVRAYNGAGDSAYSNEANATTQASGACPQVSTLSGDGVYGYIEGAVAEWRKPVGAVVGKDPASGLLAVFIADTENHRIRKVMLEGPNAGQSSLIAGDGTAGYYDGVTIDNNGPDPLTARYNNPRGITAQLDANGVVTTLLIADTSNNRIRRLTWNSSASRFSSSLVSGSGVAGLLNGTAGTSRFKAPQALMAAPDGFIYVADTGNAVIRKVTASGTSSTLIPAGTFSSPTGIAASSTSVLYVSDAGNHKVFQVSGSTATVIAGSGTAGFADGTGTAAMFNSPAQLVWANPAGGAVLYIADQNNNRIRTLTLAANAVSTLAGSGAAGFADGSCTAAQFNAPRGAAYLSSTGAVYLIDSSNNRIRKVQ
jgi:fibronectin type 3 domain-containing protein/sugar lactone lactonase YvrE